MKVVRRTQVPKYANYAKYKPLLRVDFGYRCAYCRLHERIFGQLASMGVDHFRPKSRFPHLRVDYGNLYYCCGECNTLKGDHWPTSDQEQAGERFVDVCQDEWDDHLERVADVVVGKTSAGRFTVQHVRLSRQRLTNRNRELRAREERTRKALARIDKMRQRLAKGNDAETAQDLDELQQTQELELKSILEPEPFPE